VTTTVPDDFRGGFHLEGEHTPTGVLLRDVWRSRELLAVLARKEFYVRYRRASFGLVWAVALPLVQALILAVVLSHFVRFHTGGNYPLFVFSGVLPWNFFSAALISATTSIMDNNTISTKIYFPRSLFPLMTVLSGVYGLAVTVVVLIGFGLVVGDTPGLHTLLLIPATALTIVLAMALSLVLAALQVYFRDIKFLLQAFVMGWFYLTPIFYPLNALGRAGQWLKLDPTTGFVELFRAATAGADAGWITSLWWSLGWTAGLLVVALFLYRRFDRVFADLM
jgi:lipopolysaccharide transport system permease protein